MQLEDQVCSLALAKRLKELRVKQESLFCYQPIKDSSPSVWPRNFNLHDFAHSSEDERIAAFTVSEMIEILPDECQIVKLCEGNYICKIFLKSKKEFPHFMGTLPNCCAHMLISLIQNKLMEVPK